MRDGLLKLLNLELQTPSLLSRFAAARRVSHREPQLI
jgi:hypothetical protein